MSKLISKSEAARAINTADALEVLLENIDRNETEQSKQTKLNRFVNDVKKQIEDQRDLIIISAKLK